jgi:peptide/nickel transport system substrate-binding protein
VDAYTLKIVLSNPSPAILAILSTPPASAVDPQVVEANGGVVADQPNTYMTTHPMGTGPFVVKEWVKGDHITLTKSTAYWGGANGMFPAPKLTQVVFNYRTDALARVLDIKSGTAQMIQLDLGHIADVQNQTGVTVRNIGVAPVILYLFMNTQKSPFSSTLLRQAVTHAINYDEIVQEVYSGFAARFTGPLAVGVPTYNSSIPNQSYNVTLARELLTQAGYPNGQGLPTMQFVIWAGDPTVQNMAELIQSQLAAVNINIQLQIVSFGTFMDMQSSAATNPSHPVVGITQWGADYLDPDDFATPIVWSQGFDNPAGYNNTVIDQLVMQGRYSQDPAQRAQIYSQITQITAEDAPFAWLVQIGQFFIHRSNVQGLYYNPSLGRIDLSQVSLSG